jgi:hypothetical protein
VTERAGWRRLEERTALRAFLAFEGPQLLTHEDDRKVYMTCDPDTARDVP